MKQTLSSFEILNVVGYGATPTLRLVSDQDFVAETGEVLLQGDEKTNYRAITPTLVGTTLTVPNIEDIDTNDDSSEANGTYTLYLMDSNGRKGRIIFERWKFTASMGSIVVFEDLEISNNNKVPLRDTETYSKNQINALLLSAVNVGNAATTDALGRVKVSVTGVSAASPIAVEDSDPRVNAEYFIGEYATLAAAVTDIGSTPAQLVIDSNKTVSANLTIPSTLILRFTNGAQIQPASGITVTILSPTDGFPKRQIFGGAGTISFVGSNYAPEGCAEWWGGGVGTDSTSAIQKAINSGLKQLVGLPGTYIVNGTGLTGASTLAWRGAGLGITLYQLSEDTNNNMVLFSGKSKIRVRDLTFDWNNKVAGVGGPAALAFHQSTDFTVRDVGILNFDRFGIAINGCSVFRILDNDIKRATVASTSNQGILVSASAGANSNGWITGNYLLNSGMDEDIQGVFVKHNRVENFGYGAGITTEQSETCHSNIIGDNIISGGTGIDENLYRPGGIENWSPLSIVSNNLLFDNAGAGIDQGGRFNAVNGNMIYNNGTNGVVSAGIVARYDGATYNSLYSTYTGNVSIDVAGAGGTQHYGFMTQNSSATYQTLAGNSFDVNKTAPQSIISEKVSFSGPTLEFSVLYNPPSLINGASITTDVLAPGAVKGDKVDVSFSLDLQGVQIFAWINDDNSAKVTFLNGTGGTVNLDEGTIRLAVKKSADHPTY